jgi:hypothetical protein
MKKRRKRSRFNQRKLNPALMLKESDQSPERRSLNCH